MQYFSSSFSLVYHLLPVLVERRALSVPVLLPVLLVALTRQACCLLVQVERATANSGAGRRLPKERPGRVNYTMEKKSAKSPPAASVWRARRDTAVLLYRNKNRTEQNRTEQNRTEQNRKNRTEQNRTEQNRTKQMKTPDHRRGAERPQCRVPASTLTQLLVYTTVVFELCFPRPHTQFFMFSSDLIPHFITAPRPKPRNSRP